MSEYHAVVGFPTISEQAEAVSRQVVIALSADPPNQAAFLHALRAHNEGSDPLVVVALLHIWARGTCLVTDRDETGRLAWLPRGAERYRRGLWVAAQHGGTAHLQQVIATALTRLNDRQVSLLVAWYAHAFTHAITVCGGYHLVEDIAGFLDVFITPAETAAAQPAVLLVAALAAQQPDRAEQALHLITQRPDGEELISGLDVILGRACDTGATATSPRASAETTPDADKITETVRSHASRLAALIPALAAQYRRQHPA